MQVPLPTEERASAQVRAERQETLVQDLTAKPQSKLIEVFPILQMKKTGRESYFKRKGARCTANRNYRMILI